MRKYAQCSTRDLSGAAATTEVINLRTTLASHIHTRAHTNSSHADFRPHAQNMHLPSRDLYAHTNAHLQKQTLHANTSLT